uniref:SprT-like family protein n=1 Tax=Pithovirus LCPAC302 TaxID=2506593 RepID=A0A481Z7L5_9VIRU|nr:MAG: SprT-like family protein [Pithovirus LCPAC302]
MQKRIRNIISKRLNPNFNTFNPSDIEILFKLYNKLCFNGCFDNIDIIFQISRSKNKIGEYICYKNKHTIKISSKICDLFDQEETLHCNGVLVHDRLGVLMSVLEHEIIHLYCNVILKRKTTHGKIFRDTAFNFFSHTDFRHNLFSGTQLDKKDCYIGMKVSFKLKSTDVIGVITKLNPKRAKIHIENTIYAVPYCLLTKN